MSETTTPGPQIGPGPDQTPNQQGPPDHPGTPDVVDTGGPGDVGHQHVINGVDVTDPDPAYPPTQVANGKTRLKVAYPGTYFYAGGDLPVVSNVGTDVDPDQAQQILEAAKTTPGVTVTEAG